jgi:hypothetical protein
MRLRIARIVPRPRPAQHPLGRKIFLWLAAFIGAVLCIAMAAAGLAPSPGYHRQIWEGVLGGAGIGCAAWLGWYAYRIPVGAVSDAMKRIEARRRARRILAGNPGLGAELGIGRPDLPRNFDDGGLVDINHVPEPCLAELPGLDSALARRIVETRAEVGGFNSAEDMEVTLRLSPGRLDYLRDRLLFGPLR